MSPDADSTLRSLITANRLAEADDLCRQLLAADPADAAALSHLGVIATRQRQFLQAIELLQQAISLRDGVAEYHYNLSQPLLALARHHEAELALRNAIRLDPSLASAHMNLGTALAQQNQFAEAEADPARPLRFGNDPALHINLGRVCRWQYRLDDAIQAYRRAIDVDSNFPAAYSALGSALREAGQITNAVAAFKKAVALQPGYRVAHSNLVYAMHFDPQTSAEENFAEHLRWSAKFAEPLRSAITSHSNDAYPTRRLRIAYVSPDLKNHPVGLFMEPILEHHDRQNVDVFCYADVSTNDDMTQRLRAHTDTWRATAQLNDQQLARQIREDRIDILIDLTLHMQKSRLIVFAQKPAPVQITHLAYCATSGLRAMDYCITDTHMSPAGLHDQYFTEKLLPLAQSYWCYRPSPTSPEVAPLPAITNGYITFGCLNSLAKINPHVLSLWSKLLNAVPHSKLVIHATHAQANASIRELFTNAGIPLERIIFQPHLPRDEYLNLYNQIDIALDPFPYGGGTTSLDALWMGVPLITLPGQSPLSRTGLTLLTQLSLQDLIAASSEQYVDIGTTLANDLPRLAKLRSSMRQRLKNSPLMDPKTYTQNLEAAYRFAWGRWCMAQ